MKLIVGLGNPGRIYSDTRHNIGRRIVKNLAKEYKIKLKSKRDSLSKEGKGRIKDIDFILASPGVFMNLSGGSVALLLKKYRIRTDGLLVVYDDLDLGLGRIRIRPKGSSAGHGGLESVIGSIGTKDFARLRIGIGMPGSRHKVKDFVLSIFEKDEEVLVKDALARAVDCCKTWLLEGTDKAMCKFN